MPSVELSALRKQLAEAVAKIERLESNIALACFIMKDFYSPDEERQIRRALLEGVGP